ncbi:hypothetical protein OsI_06367 [Oryza sativa Indica Group]|uniref:Secreted protein n=1 Tax=Oryza sativa subsp. indica TaxID=39946 RepID=B8AE70_ORYSI|nr:hypothetical protein OsI_06367 [Oryza sativa Indica Group]
MTTWMCSLRILSRLSSAAVSTGHPPTLYLTQGAFNTASGTVMTDETIRLMVEAVAWLAYGRLQRRGQERGGSRGGRKKRKVMK